MGVEIAAIHYQFIRDRLRAEEPEIDETTLADTVEGLSDLHDILTAILRSALNDEALAYGLKARIVEMENRFSRLRERASKRRQIVKDTMAKVGLKKLVAPDLTATVRAGLPSLLIFDEAAIPSVYWEPREPRLNRQNILTDLKQGGNIKGAILSDPEPVLSVRTR